MKFQFLLLMSVLPAAAAGANTRACEVSTFHADNLSVSEAKWERPHEDILVENCVVHGMLNPFVGTDGQNYGIEFELRLPKKWSRQFAYQFNGGNDGFVRPATGRSSSLLPQQYPLNRGMAVVSSNGGHDGQAHPEKGMPGSAYFGFDAKARQLYGYSAVEQLAPVANQMIEQFYGYPARFKYGIGSSNGGRMGMVAAARFPDMFDGILSGYPGFNLPKATLQHSWDIQHLHDINPAISQAFTQADLALVSDYILKQCDGLDGLDDGLIFNSAACQSEINLKDLVCSGERCLTHQQAEALTAMHEGPKDQHGKPLYSHWLYDAGIKAQNWRFWKIESDNPSWNYAPRIVALGAPSLAMVFMTPPETISDQPDGSLQYLLDFDLAEKADHIYATNHQFSQSGMEVMTPPDVDNPTLAAFRASHGKMIIFHGNSDPVFSVADTIRWYHKLNENHKGNARDFVTFYQVPGMPHGAGGPSLSQFDMLSALVNWVERGKQPGRVTSQANEDNAEISASLKAVTRPLCPYPTYAVYRAGNPKRATSFVCR